MALEPTTPFSFGRNPTAAPPPPAPLFPPGHIATATLFATPVAGALLIAWNLRRQQRPGAAAALVGGVGVIALALWLDVSWSSAVWWLAVPAWTLLASAVSSALFADAVKLVGRRSPVAAWLVGVATVASLYAAGAVTALVAPRALPSFHEVLFDWILVGAAQVRPMDGASREDALRVGEAIERARLIEDQRALRLAVGREEGHLVLHVRLPDASPEAVAVARRLTAAVARHLDPPECVTGRIIDVAGRTRAEGQSCP